jgi:hypothetical protein
MESKKTPRILLGMGLLGLGVVATAWAQTAYSLIINGKPSTAQAIVVKGKTYIPLDALKSAGAQTQLTGTMLSLTLPGGGGSSNANGANNGAGGANQQKGVEGKAGEWLFNGFWRFRVISMEKLTDPEHLGWKVKVEIRNGTKENNIAPSSTNIEGMEIALEDGQTIRPFGGDMLAFNDTILAQGAGNTQTIPFETTNTSKPLRLILRFPRNGTQFQVTKFSVPDPSFRVDIRNILPPE